MNDSEVEFLAMIGLGWFHVDRRGLIWRRARYTGGDTPSIIFLPEPIRAERSVARADSYLRVMFRGRSAIRMAVSAHRIVWMVTHHRPIPLCMEINHCDGAKQNNHPSNLELVTRAQNVQHAVRVLGRRPKAQDGVLNAAAKLSVQQVMEIRALASAKAMSQREIAERFGISQSTVSDIFLRKGWSHITSTG